MSHEIKILDGEAEHERALEIFYASLVAFPTPTGGELFDYVERGRTYGALVNGEIVGTATSFSGWLVVPGGRRVPHAAVTAVGVLPTHTRRGLAGALVRQQLRDCAARGEIVASLRASEAVIYERFGYGIASNAAFAEVALPRAAFRPGVPAGGPLRLVPVKTSWDLLARIYAPAAWTGAIDRSRFWWNAMQHYAEQAKGPLHVVVHGPEGAEDGFARYEPGETDDWFRREDRSVRVTDLVAHTPAALAGLLRHLFGIDLLHQVRLGPLPTDHGVEQLLVDERAVSTRRVSDETWLRLLDVLAALRARTYAGAGSVTIEVEDADLPANAGRYRISAAGVERSDGPAALRVGVTALACAYLGGTRWWQLAAGGRVAELAEGAVAAADELFATARAPFGGTMF